MFFFVSVLIQIHKSFKRVNMDTVMIMHLSALNHNTRRGWVGSGDQTGIRNERPGVGNVTIRCIIEYVRGGGCRQTRTKYFLIN